MGFSTVLLWSDGIFINNLDSKCCFSCSKHQTWVNSWLTRRQLQFKINLIYSKELEWDSVNPAMDLANAYLYTWAEAAISWTNTCWDRTGCWGSSCTEQFSWGYRQSPAEHDSTASCSQKKTTVVLDYMNRNVACEIRDVVLLHVVGECLSWNMLSSCRQNSSWKMWSSWGQAEKSSEKDGRLGLFQDHGRDVFKSVRAAKEGEIKTFPHCCR